MLAIKRNIIYTLSITSQAFTLHLPYVLLFRNEDCFYDCLCSSVTVFLFLQLCRLDLGIQLCIYSHKTADEPRFFNWSNASDLWNRRCSHALCHLPSAIDVGIFLLGLIAATMLEYVTGVVMEALFQVRYWDYSDKKFNIQGHICLSSSLAWGVFTLLLIRVVHPRISALLERIPQSVCFGALFVITIVFSIDFASSFHAAMDLRQILESITNLKSDAEKLRERFIVLTDSVSETLRDKIGTIKKPESSRIEEFQTSVSEYLEKLYSLVPKEKTADVIRLKERFAYLGELKNAISKRMDFRKIILLKGNPMLTSKKYADALNSLKEQIGLNKNK